MFRFLKRAAAERQQANLTKLRATFLAEFEVAIAKLRLAPESGQIAVGTAIGQARRDFQREHGNWNSFQKLPVAERHSYLERLTAAENAAREPAACAGVGLFKMYVGALSAKDAELSSHFYRALDDFAKRGAPPL